MIHIKRLAETRGAFSLPAMSKSPRVSHPFPPVFDSECKVLILGSLPSEKSREEGFYYMHPRNRFWRLLSCIFDEDFTIMSAAEKSTALLSHHIALSDVVLSCEIHRSDDASIREVECTDVASLLAGTKINRILLNGQKAYGLFLKFFPEYEALAVLLPSTSPANARCSLEDLLQSWRPFFK